MSAQPTQPSLHDTLRESPPTIPVFAGASWRDQVARLADAYHHDGFVVVQALFDRDAVAGWQAECERLWHDEQLADPESFRVDSRKTLRGASIAERMDPVIDVSPLFATLARHPDILGIGTVLLGEEPVLFKDKLIFKMPGTTGYPLHQDFAYITDFGFSGDRQLAACLVIDETNPANGATEFFPGMHHQLLAAPPGRPGEVDEHLVDLSTGIQPSLSPGDVLFFHALCPHRAGPNTTELPRRLLFLTYNGRSTGDLYATYYQRGKP